MRYQQKIYNQNGNKVRNGDLLNVNTSSDICVFTEPTFGISGATKIIDSDDICEFSGLSFTNILSAATVSCSGLTSSCVDLVDWSTNIYVDGNLSYSGDFASTTYTLQPTTNQLINELSSGLSSLGYNYSVSDTELTINKPFGISDIQFDICLDFTLGGTGTTCPTGYLLNNDETVCVYTATTTATFNGSGDTISSGDTNTVYSDFGTYFYTNETLNQSLPLTRVTNIVELEDQSGGTINYTDRSFSGNSFWDSLGIATNGRLNNSGISASTTEWLGFSHCLDILSGGTYYIGMGADNQCRFSIDGELFVELGANHDRNFKIWHIFPYEFSAGKHIIEMEGINNSSDSAFGSEIYSPINLSTLTGATTTGDTGMIFSTADKVGELFDIGTTIGYSCPSGYALDLCAASATCTEILYDTPTVCTFTGTCEEYCESACTQTYDTITSASTGVYIVDDFSDNIVLDINFTGNTFSGDDIFKYEVYKYHHTNKVFQQPAIYKSDEIEYQSFSATSALTETIPVSGLSIDGDYLLKGYYITDICTDILSNLDLTYDTSIYKVGDSYSIYSPEFDYYFVVCKEAEVPQLVNSSDTTRPLGSLVAYSTLPTDGETNILIQTEVQGDLLVYLNGLLLSEGLDYVLSGDSIELSGATISGDVITYVSVANSETNGLVNDIINIDTPIVSGTTDNEGSELTYYNTTEGKYEIYTLLTPVNGNDISVTLNGVTLAPNIDFYQSISNPKRIILEGNLLVGDIINIVYNAYATFVGDLFTNTPTINWSIPAPQLSNGIFTVQVATNTTFGNIISSATTEYIKNVSAYSTEVTITGSVGTDLVYRILNEKNYVTLIGDTISTSTYSEVVPITIMSNAINSY